MPSMLRAEKVRESTCYGTTKKGRLENGVRLPRSGTNFVPYSSFGVMAGRTYVHSKVFEVIVKTYAILNKTHPDKIFMYGETGFKNGGKFKPHKTHQNGLSADFMVSVLDKAGKSVPLPTSIFNKFGYSLEFDKKGGYKDYTIDFEAMAAHLMILHKECQKAGIGIWRVIFDPELQPYLFKVRHGSYLIKKLRFSEKPSWVRHDEHYHVDFKVKCKKKF
ncbi:penicillin-insensitive murein endopeptidase [Desulfonema magnum]|nr:penicillin-insensitive murein endopeptidase [Desulfonema magnum]